MHSIVFAMMLSMSRLGAAETCTAFDMSTWGQGQRNHLLAVSSWLVNNAGHTAQVSEPTPGTVCADIQVHINTVVTLSALSNRWSAMQDEWAAQRAEAEALALARAQEAATNPVCKKSLAEIEQAIDAQFEGANSIAVLRQRTVTAFKYAARCMWAHREE